MTTVCATQGSPAELARFTSVIRSELFAMYYESDSRALSSPPKLAGVEAGPVDVLRYSGLGEQWGGRDHRLIGDDHADYHVICVPVSARLTVRQNGSINELRQDTFTMLSTGRPFQARICSESERDFFSALHVRVPGPLLRRRIPNIDDVCGREFRALRGSSRMMLSLFDIALSEGPYLSIDERLRLGNELLEVICAVASRLADTTVVDPPRPSAYQRTFECARAFIASHLSDPELDPTAIAEHCNVSTRFLHASFRALSDQTVVQLIRESRLQACREALTNPKLRWRTIIDIAGEWGFDDPAHFSRLYRARFGRTPREHRKSVGPAAPACHGNGDSLRRRAA